MKITHALLLLTFAFPVSCAGCMESVEEAVEAAALQDLTPPVLVEGRMADAHSAVLTFSETLDGLSETDSGTSRTQGTSQIIAWDTELLPGESRILRGRVRDEAGNSTRYTTTLWGKNADPAGLLITQASTKGTEKNPDRVEITVTGSGNLAGITVANGPPLSWSDRCVLPDRWVWEGEKFVVKFQRGEAECDWESESLAGLGANNGVVAVLSDPSASASVMDALVYASGESTAQDGWGTAAVQDRVAELAGLGGWASSLPADAVESRNATATRPFARRDLKDTGTKADWCVLSSGSAVWGGT